MNRTRVVTGVSAVVAAIALVGTGAALSGAATGPATSTPSATSSAPADRPAPHAHTAVTGDELAKVTAAVKAEDSAVTVTAVQKDPDGSYDVMGTKAGTDVRLEVSKDLTTITTGPAGGPGRGKGGPGGGHAHTPVTGDELAKVTAAVRAEDSAVTVTAVQKDPDGSYDVLGTKAGTDVRLEVSKDLTTITTGPAGGPGRGEGAPGAPGAPGADKGDGSDSTAADGTSTSA